MKIKTIYLILLVIIIMCSISCEKYGLAHYSEDYYRTDYTINNETTKTLSVVFGDLLNSGGINPYTADSIRQIPAGENLTFITQFTVYRIQSTEEAVKTFGKLNIYIDDSIQSQTDFLQPQSWKIEKSGSIKYEAILNVTPSDF